MTLYETLQALTGPNREVDARIAMLFEPEGEDGTYFRAPFISEIRDKDCVDGQYWKCAISGRSLRTAPKYTADLNAVIDLVEREIPRACTFLDNEDETWDGEPIWNATTHTHKASHTIPAVALLMALMDAKGFKQ